jgi:hypothetical protein
VRRRYTGDGNGNSNGNGCFDRTALRAVQDGGFAANRERLTATTGNGDGNGNGNSNGWEWGRQRLLTGRRFAPYRMAASPPTGND